mmetsp:Transcript_8245/g.24773  ORF Transcript_8245/g.24773 Transcript_8245/m.24773 type:complete len:98 (-) Transcript_8245:922-1215(-)
MNVMVQTVEYWSGGFNLFGSNSGCAVQRVMQLDAPELWEEGLIWHTSNNKQRVITKERHWDAEWLRRAILDRWTRFLSENSSKNGMMGRASTHSRRG